MKYPGAFPQASYTTASQKQEEKGCRWWGLSKAGIHISIQPILSHNHAGFFTYFFYMDLAQ